MKIVDSNILGRKGGGNMGTFLPIAVLAIFIFFILTAGYNEDKTGNL
jgi:hypothetical protein